MKKVVKPTQAEKIKMIREAQELNVPFKEVFNRWMRERGIADGTARRVRSDKKSQPVTIDKVYVPPAIDDGPVYEESVIPPFTRMRIYSHLRRLSLERTDEQIWKTHREALADPIAFAKSFGEEFAKLIIQL